MRVSTPEAAPADEADCSVISALTASVVEPTTPLPGCVAAIVVEPVATLVASPSLPPALLTVATPAADELHVTAVVRSCVVLSLNVPVAANCCVTPSAIDGFVGVTANDTGDGDAGTNNLQNFPVLATARTNGSNQLLVTGTLNSTANSYYRIEFFANTSQDGTGYGEGRIYLGYGNLPQTVRATPPSAPT